MPWFAYVKDQFGVHGQIIHADAWEDRIGPRDLTVIEMYSITVHESRLVISELSKIYPLQKRIEE